MRKIPLILLAGLFAAGCNKFDSDINTDPNRPSKASGIQLIANSELSLAGLSTTPQGEYLAQYLGETQYPGASLYPAGGTSFYGLYQGPLINLEKVLTSELTPADGPIANQRAVAKILKAYYFWHITDRWGDVPMNESLKGADNFTPKYDRQEVIYDSIFKWLNDANATIVPGNISNEIMYAGDIGKWKRFGNSVHLLAALRLSEVNAAKANTEFNKALTDGVMTANTDNFTYKHLSDATNQSYWYGQVVNQNREWWALSENLVNYMDPIADPRLPIFAKKNSGNIYKGIPFGTTVGVPNTTGFSLIGPAIYAQNAQIALVTYAQVLFAKAEGAKRGWTAGSDAEAKTNYDLAISNSILQWTGSTSTVATFMMQTGIPYSAGTALQQIAMQRYVHLFMHGYEAWAEWRRTGYPNNLVTPGGAAVPLRNSYPPNEVFNNGTNYNAAVAAFPYGGTDALNTRVWWDKP
ncbi:MAG TPA: SusD/RagB family nutrient-binding outer membrane lipoprotein [Chitinophagaceae bacterium]